MILGKALNYMISMRKSSHKRLAEKIGKKNGSAIGNIIIRNNCTVDTLLDVAEALDFEVVLRPKEVRDITITLTNDLED